MELLANLCLLLLQTATFLRRRLPARPTFSSTSIRLPTTCSSAAILPRTASSSTAVWSLPRTSPAQLQFATRYVDSSADLHRIISAKQSSGGPPPPPTAPQQFGHGAPNSYNFRYSNCTGRRKALLIGINYFNQRGQLRGCINDVRNMTAYLSENFGYKREDMVILTDDQQNAMSQPTKQNILRAMHWLVKDARPNDSLFFHYSGTDYALAGLKPFPMRTKLY